MITRVEAQLKNKDMALELTPLATKLLARRGFDPVLGARPLRRTIQREIEDQLRNSPAGRPRAVNTCRNCTGPINGFDMPMGWTLRSARSPFSGSITWHARWMSRSTNCLLFTGSDADG